MQASIWIAKRLKRWSTSLTNFFTQLEKMELQRLHKNAAKESGESSMMKTHNTLDDLNNHLFSEMERLNNDALDGEPLEQELRRADGISKIATQIIGNARTILSVQVAYQNNESADPTMPRVLQMNEVTENGKALDGVRH